MTTDDRQDEDDWVPPGDDDLGRAFGPDTRSVPVRPIAQRIRTWTLVGGGVVVVAAVVLGALSFLVNGVQTGIGGVFRKPDAAVAVFRSAASEVAGVDSATHVRTEKTTFASYDVTELVTTDDALDDAAQERLVDGLSAATVRASGNGTHVYAIVRIGTMRVGVSPSVPLTEHRLALARQLDAIGGVDAVTCTWSGDGEGGAARDTADGQRVVVETPATGEILGAITLAVHQKTSAVFPEAQVAVQEPNEH